MGRFNGIRYRLKQSGCHLWIFRVEENMFSRNGGDMNERGTFEIYVKSAFSYTGHTEMTDPDIRQSYAPILTFGSPMPFVLRVISGIFPSISHDCISSMLTVCP